MFSVYNSNFGIVEYAFFFLFFFVTVNEEFSGLLGTGFNDLNIGGIRSGKSPFCFENMWLRVEGFKDLVRRWWTGYTFSGSFSHILACKLKALKQDLKTWNREVLGNVFSNKEAALSQIGYWDAK